MDVERWDHVAANNTEAPPDGAPENMLRSGLNDVIREIMAAVRRLHQAPQWLNEVYGYTVSKYGPRVVQIADTDARSYFPAGRRIRVSSDGTTWYYGSVVSASKPGSHTLVTVDMEPNLGYDELASGINLTFADADPDTITAASGTPFSSLVDGDQVRVRLSPLNSGIFEIDGATGTIITLASGESLSAEGPIAAKIYQETGTVPAGIDRIQVAVAAYVGGATRSVGSGVGQLLTAQHVEPHVFKPEGAGGGINADQLDGKDALTLQTETATLTNLLVNSDFNRWQEGESWASPDNDDDTYVCDQWKLLSDGNDIVDVEKITSGLPVDCLAGIRLTWQTADEEAALFQMVEQLDCQPVLGGSKKASFICRIKGNTTYPEKMRAAIVSWSGTADDCTSDPVNDAGPYGGWAGAGTLPDMKTGFTIEDYDEITLDGTWQSFYFEDVSIDTANVKNVGVLIWSEDDTISVGSIVEIARVRLLPGSLAYDLDAESGAILYERTDRYFWKSFNDSIAPAHGASDANAALYCSTNSDGDGFFVARFPVRMLKLPTLAAYHPTDSSPSGSNYVDRLSDPTDYAISSTRVGEGGFSADIASAAANEPYRCHFTAIARFF